MEKATLAADLVLEELDRVTNNHVVVVDSRREPRYVKLGDVSITVDHLATLTISGQLCDVSDHGFRATYVGNLLSSGTEVTFRHQMAHGRAKVVWSRHVPEGNQSGFYIQRE